ncbi:MAG: AAA family ATPase [candidate division Zixibacteria bacterium]|nr:AAA family ATPase [Candidatus Tariuqbacter arcticus]
MVKKIALFNHKGGVSKTTTTFNLGWMLAEKGKKVVMVDADPQCNLTGMVLGYSGPDEFEQFYLNEPERNLRSGLSPAFESKPELIKPVECVPVSRREGLFILPGHIRLSEYEVTLGIAQELSSSIQTLRNIPGSISLLIEETSKNHNADYVLIDMNPSLSSINQNLLMTSDFFLVPTSPDYFSVMAINSLATFIPKWQDWAVNAHNSQVLREANYPFPKPNLKFLGTIIQNYRLRYGAPTIGFQKWINQINETVSTRFVPVLNEKNIMLPINVYKGQNIDDDYCLAKISDFNTLIATSQENNTPVFALSDEQLGYGGSVLDAIRKKTDEFNRVFSEIADKIIGLTENENSI